MSHSSPSQPALSQSTPQTFPIESLLAARLFLAPQIAGDRIYFVSDLSGRLSLYSMQLAGSVPAPLLPPNIALQNPHHMGDGYLFAVLPKLGKIMIMLDHDGDENYQPMFIPLEGGIPAPLFGDRFAGKQVLCDHFSAEHNMALFSVDLRTTPEYEMLRADLASGELTLMSRSRFGSGSLTASDDYSHAILLEQYTFGDSVAYSWRTGGDSRRKLYGTPQEERRPGEQPPLTGFTSAAFTPTGNLLFVTALFSDNYGLGFLGREDGAEMQPVETVGVVHTGVGEMTHVRHRSGNRFTVTYNIDGVSWVYEGSFDQDALRFTADRVLVGQGVLAGGVLEALEYDAATGRYALSFSTATSPSQLYLIDDSGVTALTEERVLGIAPDLLSPGEDASYTSFDGLRVSARLYMPAPALGYAGPRPVIFYIHGGPQSQERPDFTWFSMPLIQYFTLHGFAVFAPNVRGSSGYGMDYMKRVDHDWGGQDRLDHVAAFELLRRDPRLDLDRAGVMGRSYGGYMTLTQVGRHPELWKAACDMFGPYNLFTFIDRLPETWKVYFYEALGHPEKDHDFLVERSPSTHLHNLACPMLVIQGANDPRVTEQESADLVETLREQGKQVEFLVFRDEGHDVLKFANKVTCYTRIVDFFAEHLQPQR